MQELACVHQRACVFSVSLVWAVGLGRGLGGGGGGGVIKGRLIALWETKGSTIMCSLAANLGAWVRSQGTPQVLYFKFLSDKPDTESRAALQSSHSACDLSLSHSHKYMETSKPNTHWCLW